MPPGPEALASPPARSGGLASLGLEVNLGPLPPLATQAQPKTPPLGSAVRAPATHQGLGARHWLLGAGALAMVAAVAGMLFGSGLIGLARSSGTAPGPGTRSSNAVVKANTKGPGEVPPDQPIAVKLPDGTVRVEPNLKSAMQRAIGSKGHVVLNNSRALALSGSEAELAIGGGPLYIRAAAGVRPVVEVEIGRQKPFLSTKADTPLTIVGVTIVARYRSRPKTIPPVIHAGADMTLERCAFTVKGTVEGARAVVSEGSRLTVDGCWFAGFATALDVASFAGSNTTIKQSMMVQTAADTQPIGWALRIQQAPGGKPGERRRLLIEHCTSRGEGLLELVDFTPQAPLQVAIKQCAVLSHALLAWQTPAPGTPLTVDALEWQGEGNQYDIRGKSWVVLSSDGTSELRDGPIDLASWRSKVVEHDPVLPPVRFRVDPASLSESPQPDDFAIIDPEIRPPGADPARVGPTGGR
jgi:serine/threonine-protein kinase